MRRLFDDPIGLVIFVVMAILFYFAWNFVTDRMSPEEGEEFGAAKILFGVFVVLLLVGWGLRSLIHVVLKV